jgi:hypothetical protein
LFGALIVVLELSIIFYGSNGGFWRRVDQWRGDVLSIGFKWLLGFTQPSPDGLFENPYRVRLVLFPLV